MTRCKIHHRIITTASEGGTLFQSIDWKEVRMRAQVPPWTKTKTLTGYGAFQFRQLNQILKRVTEGVEDANLNQGLDKGCLT